MPDGTWKGLKGSISTYTEVNILSKVKRSPENYILSKDLGDTLSLRSSGLFLLRDFKWSFYTYKVVVFYRLGATVGELLHSERDS